MNVTALIAEDEPLLAQALKAELGAVWPALKIVAQVGDGASAASEALRLTPDVLFCDIRMPGQSGLEAAAELADAWPPSHATERPFPVLVFVTAYDQYAVQAFEAQAVDYLLKPVSAERLQKTVSRVKQVLALRSASPAPQALDATVNQLRALLGSLDAPQMGAGNVGNAATSAPPLRMLQCSVGASIHMVPVEAVLYFEAADKYVRVLTAEREYLIRTALKEMMPQLDPAMFWQVHRGTVVRAQAIETVSRDDAGKLHLSLRGLPGKLPVSRLYAHLFKAM